MSRKKLLPILIFITFLSVFLLVWLFKRFKKKDYLNTPYRFCLLLLMQVFITLILIITILLLKPDNVSRTIAWLLLANLPITGISLLNSAQKVTQRAVKRMIQGTAVFLFLMTSVLVILFVFNI